jgi:hypothetical protein
MTHRALAICAHLNATESGVRLGLPVVSGRECVIGVAPVAGEEFRSVKYTVDKTLNVATITLSRPTRLNAIDAYMPSEIRRAGELVSE